MTKKQFEVQYDGWRYFHIVDTINERCIARLDTKGDADAYLEIIKDYEELIKENEELKKENKDLKTSQEYWREKCLSKDSYNKFHHKAPIWFTQEIKLTNKEVNKVAEAIEQDLKERRIKE